MSRRNEIKVYAADGSDRVVRRCDRLTAQRLVSRGSARIFDDPASGQFKGIRLVVDPAK